MEEYPEGENDPMSWLSWIVGIIVISVAVYIGQKLMDKRLDRREGDTFLKFPILRGLKQGQLITVALKNGNELSQVEFVKVFSQSIDLASDKRIDEKTGVMAYHKLLKVKVKDIASIRRLE